MSLDLKSARTEGVRILWHVGIPMRDGTELDATFYRGDGTAARAVVLMLSPYQANRDHDRAKEFVAFGFSVALVDVRGRGSSQGVFDCYRERDDAFDVIEWLAVQPWCDGNVVMCGSSYLAIAQWQAARSEAPHLQAIVPAATTVLWHFGVYLGGIFQAAWAVEMAVLRSGKTTQTEAFADHEYWSDLLADFAARHLPIRDLPAFAGLAHPESAQIATWLDHPAADSYWDDLSVSGEDYARIDLPVLSICGFHDVSLRSTVKTFCDHYAACARATHYLLIGPWDHSSVKMPSTRVGSLLYGPLAALNLTGLSARWYQFALGRGGRPRLLADRVVYYVAGAEEWRSAPDLSAVEAERRSYYLRSDRQLHTEVGEGGRFNFSFDPTASAPYPSRSYFGKPGCWTDASIITVEPGEGVVYLSELLTSDVEIIGRPEARVFLELDVPDTDLRTVLFQILPDGSTLLLSEDFLRARYRVSSRTEVLAKPGEVYMLSFPEMMFVSRRMPMGSRLGFAITCVNSARLERNYNSGGRVADECGDDARVATVTVHHGAEYPSAITVPVGKRDPSKVIDERLIAEFLATAN